MVVGGGIGELADWQKFFQNASKSEKSSLLKEISSKFDVGNVAPPTGNEGREDPLNTLSKFKVLEARTL